MISSELKTYRVGLGLNQRQIAETLKVTRQTYNRWENGGNINGIPSWVEDELLYLLASKKESSQRPMLNKRRVVMPGSSPLPLQRVHMTRSLLRLASKFEMFKNCNSCTIKFSEEEAQSYANYLRKAVRQIKANTNE
jgi:Helix-turn-helix.